MTNFHFGFTVCKRLGRKEVKIFNFRNQCENMSEYLGLLCILMRRKHEGALGGRR